MEWGEDSDREEGSLFWGISVWEGVFVLGVSVQKGFCTGVSVQGVLCPGGLSIGVSLYISLYSGWYVSYWNAFLFIFIVSIFLHVSEILFSFPTIIKPKISKLALLNDPRALITNYWNGINLMLIFLSTHAVPYHSATS